MDNCHLQSTLEKLFASGFNKHAIDLVDEPIYIVLPEYPIVSFSSTQKFQLAEETPTDNAPRRNHRCMQRIGPKPLQQASSSLTDRPIGAGHGPGRPITRAGPGHPGHD